MMSCIFISLALFAQTKPAPASSSKPIAFNTPEADRVLERLQVFPKDNPWNQDVSKWPVSRNSRAIVESVGAAKPLRYNPDMNFILIPPNQPKLDMKVGYPYESDKGPFPVPDELPIEGWAGGERNGGITLDQYQRNVSNDDSDRHAIIVDPQAGLLYEFYQMKKTKSGWVAAQASMFNLNSNKLRPQGWTSSDAAGLPIFPAIVRYDELARGEIRHALRVTVRKSRKAYVAPATHFASPHTDPNLPRMGERFRLRSDFEINGFTPEVKVILQALKTYGMFVADNGIEWAISVSPDSRIPVLHHELRAVKGSDFEVVVSHDTGR